MSFVAVVAFVLDLVRWWILAVLAGLTIGAALGLVTSTLDALDDYRSRRTR